MPFPLTISGCVPLPQDESEAAEASDRLIAMLESQGAEVTLQYPPDVTLSVPFFRGFRWPWGADRTWAFLSSLDRIELKHEFSDSGRVLRYRLSLLRLVTAGTLMSPWIVFVAPRLGMPVPLWVAPLIWAWVVGGNYLLTRFRARKVFSRFISTVATSPTMVASVTTRVEPLRERAKTTAFPPISR